MDKFRYKRIVWLCMLLFSVSVTAGNRTGDCDDNGISSGEIWKDIDGNVINAHGGGVLYHNGMYYWYGEHRPSTGFTTQIGVTCYSSKDLKTWKNEGVALAVSDKAGSDNEKGCILERPKVIYNKKTGKFVMWFHLELKGKGYEAARAGVAVSDTPAGPYRFIRSGRVNPGIYPANMTPDEQKQNWDLKKYEWWTSTWRDAVDKGMFVKRDLEGGQMSRDMTLYVDTDGKAYHIYSSEENLTLHIAELSDDYLSHSGKYIRIFSGGHNEAPAIFKKEGVYWMIASGCTGWKPNEARLMTTTSILGEWKQLPNPCIGKKAEMTFGGQSTYILPVEGKENEYIFMADEWHSDNLSDSRYIWLPIQFTDKGTPFIQWKDKWSPSVSSSQSGWELVWSDEFNGEGRLDSTVWNYENGFARNEEAQWYQADNASCTGGNLVIEARCEKDRKNPLYKEGSKDWRAKREMVEYTSSSVTTAGKKEFLYGRFEVRARIPVEGGAWPAIWLLGSSMEWPSNGEIDVMEYYRIGGVPHILANAVWGTDRQYHAKWNSKKIPFKYFTDRDSAWAEKFHVWRMDWDESAIRIYLDDELLNDIPLSETINGSLGQNTNPFHKPQYLLLNLAIGGINGGDIDDKAIPMKYEIDYVRVYQKNDR